MFGVKEEVVEEKLKKPAKKRATKKKVEGDMKKPSKKLYTGKKTN